MAVVVATVASCSYHSNIDRDTVDSVALNNIDSLILCPYDYLGKKVKVTGRVSKIGRAEERRMFLEGTSDTMLIRCDATFKMGGRFSPRDVGKKVAITGLMQEMRITYPLLTLIERNYSDRLKQYQVENDTEEDDSVIIRKAMDAGFPTLKFSDDNSSMVQETLAGYRRKIAERKEKEGKEYLSVFYIDVVDYKVLE